MIKSIDEKEYKRQWYIKNKDTVIKRSRNHYNLLKDFPEHREKRHRYYLENREIIKSRTAQHRKNNPSIVRDSDKRHYEKNKVVRIAKMKQYATLHPEVNLMASANYRKNHKEQRKLSVIATEGKRRAQKLKTFIGKIDYEMLLSNSNGVCGICLLPLGEKYHFDHIIPLSKNGSHTQDNIQVTHPTCNLRKSVKLNYKP